MSHKSDVTAKSDGTPAGARTGDVPGATVNSRMTLLLVVIVATSIAGLAVSLWYPEPDAAGQFTYDGVAPVREFWWAWHLFAGANLVVGVTALALAGLRLVPSRGAVWATVGAGMMWLGAALYGVGLGGLGTAYLYATAPVLDPASGTALVQHLGSDFARLYGPVLPGAGLVAIGTVALSVALWRARSVPRWIPLLAGASILATFVVETSGPLGLIVEGPVAISSVAIGWYAWRRRTVTDEQR